MSEKIEKIEKISSITGGRDVNAPDEIYNQDAPSNIQANKEHFDSLMMQQDHKKPAIAPAESVSSNEAGRNERKPSLMDEITSFNKKINSATNSDPTNIKVQANELIAQMDELKTKLSTSKEEVKSSVKNLLTSELSHVDESLKIVLNKAGVEYASPAQQKNLATPIERFLGFITDAQVQLDSMGNDINKMAIMKDQISPAAMIAVQVKLGYVQNQVEFFTAILSQGLQATKTIMNIQV